MVMSFNTAKQAIAAARTRIGKDAAEILTALISGGAYTSGAGFPTTTPKAPGERYFDSTNKVWYRSNGTTSADWAEEGGASAAGLVPVGAALTVSAQHHGKTLLLDTAAGSIVTLPAATGSGLKVRVKVKLLATSNSHKVQVTGDDTMKGVVNMIDADTAGTTTGFATASDSDTVTLNRSTTGSVRIGEWLEFEDIATDVWTVCGQLSNSGDGATPFSAAVS